MQPVVRFCPSPTGDPHVGLMRTALFNYLYAKSTGGKLILRIEDTDAARSTTESADDILDALEWLGLDWDEGPGKGGPSWPYVQSLRSDLYEDAVARLLRAGLAYCCACTPEEEETRRGHKAAGTATSENMAHCQDGAKSKRVFLRMPGGDNNWEDLIRGKVRSGREWDYALTRADGSFLYTLTNPLDDALMGVTHVIRGEDLLSSTPRQIQLFKALGEVGIGTGRAPQYAHLPFVRGAGNKKLAKRDAGAALSQYKDMGFAPEALIGYLAGLGWSAPSGKEMQSLEEMASEFNLEKITVSPARFDLAKATALAGGYLRGLDPEDYANRLAAWCEEYAPQSEKETVRAFGPLVQTRANTYSDAWELIAWAFEKGAPAQLSAKDSEAVRAAMGALSKAPWEAQAVNDAMRDEFEKCGYGLKDAFGAVRLAITGKKVTPPLPESMIILGRGEVMARLQATLGMENAKSVQTGRAHSP